MARSHARGKELAVATIRKELVKDIGAREALLDLCFGDARFAKASERLREGRLPADGLSFVAGARGRLVASVRLCHVTAGPGRSALLLGPLAVHPDFRCRGIGAALMRHAIEAARKLGHRAILLVAMRPTTVASAFRRRKPARSGCRGATSSTACSPMNSCRTPSMARAG